jgi:hypothetical protein
MDCLQNRNPTCTSIASYQTLSTVPQGNGSGKIIGILRESTVLHHFCLIQGRFSAGGKTKNFNRRQKFGTEYAVMTGKTEISN